MIGEIKMAKLFFSATPTLKGKDAEKLINDVKRKPSESAIVRIERAKKALESARR